MTNSYRWGIIGPGKIAEKFATGIAHTQRAELYAVASRDASRGQAFAKRHGATMFYNNYEQLVADPLVDVVYIATPHAFHYDGVLLCLQYRKRVVCEKPLALSYSQVSEMIATAKANQVFLMEGMWSCFMPSVIKMLALIQEDAIGEVQYVRADFGFRAPKDMSSRLYDLQLGGGSLLDVGVYPLFLATLLLGAPTTVHTVAKLSESLVDEYCDVQLCYPGEKMAHIFSSITMDTIKDAEVYGTAGKLILHSPWYKATQLSLQLNNGQTQAFDFPHACNGFEYEIRHVTECMDNNILESPLMTHALSTSISKTMDAILKQAGIQYAVSKGV